MGSGPGSISFLENAGVRIRVRVTVDANPKTALFLKKKIDPDPGPAPPPPRILLTPAKDIFKETCSTEVCHKSDESSIKSL